MTTSCSHLRAMSIPSTTTYPMDTMEISQDNNVPPASAPERSWVEESLDRYANPLSFSKSTIIPEPEVMEEKMLQSASGGHSIKLVTALLKERPVWSKISLVWTFRLADVEGDQESQTLVVSLVFDSWTGEVKISENNMLKVNELQKPIIGGSWKSKSEFGEVEVKIEPYWTGYQYELWFDGKQAYSFFT